MNIFDRLKTILAGVILAISSIFPAAAHTVKTPQQVVTPTVAEKSTVAPSITIAAKIESVIIASPSATPTPSLETINKCNQLTHHKEYFDGLRCYPQEYQQYLKDQKIESVDPVQEKLFITLKFVKNTNTKELLTNACLKIGPVAYEHCNGSLEKNADRLKNQLIGKNDSDLKVCLSSIAEGDGKTRDVTKELYWKAKMKEKLDEIYTHCAQNNESLDKYNF